jgi:hypothetical protein
MSHCSIRNPIDMPNASCSLTHEVATDNSQILSYHQLDVRQTLETVYTAC